MTEAQWLAGEDPEAMLGHLEGKASPRKLRLFACACCRRLWHLLEDARSREALEVSERFADGQAVEADVQAAVARAWEAVEAIPDSTSGIRLAEDVASFAFAILRHPSPSFAFAILRRILHQMRFARHVAEGVRLLLHLPSDVDECLAHCDLLRDLFGNPFRPATLNPAWRTPDAVALAQAAYDQRPLPAGTLDAARLAVLADALEEAGCSDGAMLSHLRGPGHHVRGCWVVDLILNRG
jgi:hypothetical protein